MKLYRHAARLQTVSSPIAKRIQQELSEADGDLTKVLPYPLDPAFLQPVELQRNGQAHFFLLVNSSRKGIRATNQSIHKPSK